MCLYIYIINIHSTHRYIMKTKTFILDVINRFTALVVNNVSCSIFALQDLNMSSVATAINFVLPHELLFKINLNSQSDGSQVLCNSCFFFFFYVPIKKKVIYTLDGLRVSKLTANVHFLGVSYPFKSTLSRLSWYTRSCSVHYCEQIICTTCMQYIQ